MLQITDQGRELIRQSLRASIYMRKRPITLPVLSIQKKAKPGRRINGERRERILGNVIAMLKTGTFSKFEFEGACRNGIRAALCLDSWTWTDADRAASEIVGAALNQIGAVRPSWLEGQPDFSAFGEVDRLLCAQCGKLILENHLSKYAGGRTKYCSQTCGTYARRDRQGADYEKMTLVEFLAQQAVRSQRTLEEHSRDCERCGTHFLTTTPGRKYCSRPCFTASVTRHEPRPCKQCGTPFKPRLGRGMPGEFCSPACSGTSRTSGRVEKSCKACAAVFMVRPSELARSYCSQACNPRGPRTARPASPFQCQEITS